MTSVAAARRGYAFVLAGATCFVVNAGVSKVAMSAGVDPPRLSSVRCAGTAAGLLLLVLVTGRASALRVRRDELPLLLTYGVAGVAMLQLTYFVAIDRLPVGIALLLQYLAPLLIALWARLVTREPVRRTVWFALGLSLVGLALVGRVWDGAFLDPVGVVAGVGAGVSFATYFLAGERGLRRRDPLTFSFWGFFLGSLFWSALRPWWELGRDVVLGSTSLLGALSHRSVPVWAVLAWVVVLGTLTPFVLETTALRVLPATVVGVVAMVEPIGAAALAWVWFGEALSAVQVVGGVVVLSGIVLAQLARGKGEPAAPLG